MFLWATPAVAQIALTPAAPAEVDMLTNVRGDRISVTYGAGELVDVVEVCLLVPVSHLRAKAVVNRRGPVPETGVEPGQMSCQRMAPVRQVLVFWSWEKPDLAMAQVIKELHFGARQGQRVTLTWVIEHGTE